MQENFTIENKIFVVSGSKKLDFQPDFSRIIVNSSLDYVINEKELFENDNLFRKVEGREKMALIVKLVSKILNEYELDEDDDEDGFEFSFSRKPSIKISLESLVYSYLGRLSKIKSMIKTLDINSFLDVDFTNKLIHQIAAGLDRVFIWDSRYPSPVTLDIYLRDAAAKHEYSEEDELVMYIHDIYDVGSGITFLPYERVAPIERNEVSENELNNLKSMFRDVNTLF